MAMKKCSECSASYNDSITTECPICVSRNEEEPGTKKSVSSEVPPTTRRAEGVPEEVNSPQVGEQQQTPAALEVTASETDALLNKVLRAQVATMHYSQTLAWTGLFFVLQVVAGAVLWLVFLLSDSYSGPPEGLIAVIVLAWLAAAVWLIVTIAGAMQEALRSRNSI
jgi:hypothetical protein